MAFEHCIAEIVAAGGGRIDAEEAERILQRTFDRTSRYERGGVSRADAAVRAARELADEGRIAAAYARRDAALNALVRDALDARVLPGKEAESVRGVLSGTEGRGRGLALSIDAEAHATQGRLTGGVVADLRSAGLLPAVKRRNKSFEQDIGRELWRLEDPTAGAPTGAGRHRLDLEQPRIPSQHWAECWRHWMAYEHRLGHNDVVGAALPGEVRRRDAERYGCLRRVASLLNIAVPSRVMETLRGTV